MVAKRKPAVKEEKGTITDLLAETISTAKKKTKTPAKPKPNTIEVTRADYDKIKGKWKYADNSIEEIGVVDTIEFLTPDERIHFVNEIHRVLKQGGKATIVTPYWAASKAFSNLSVVWPPIVETWYFHLSEEWRKLNNPTETRYTCDFDATWGYGMHQLIVNRNQEYQQHAIIFWKEAAQDLIATIIKR